MNKKDDECDVIKNLALQHMEGTTNEGSERFIKKHFETCETCRKYYAKLATQLQDKEEQEKEEKIINQFEKVHRRIGYLKKILLANFILLVLVVCILGVRWLAFAKIVNTSYEKMQYLTTLDNYKITTKTTYKNLKENTHWELEEKIYYKDGKWKKDNGDEIGFYYTDKGDSISVLRSTKQKNYVYRDFIVYKKENTFASMFSEIKSYRSITPTIYSVAFEVRNDIYNGIECYVIRFGNKASHRDTWVDKNTFIPVRVVDETIGDICTEVIFCFEEGIVTEEDVDNEFLNYGEYQDYTRRNVKGEMTEELKIYMELKNKEEQQLGKE